MRGLVEPVFRVDWMVIASGLVWIYLKISVVVLRVGWGKDCW
jgi:hypothetical protein